MQYLYHTLTDANPLRITLDKIDGIIRIYYGTKYLTVFGAEKCDTIYNRIRYLISQESVVTYIFSHYFPKINVGS